MRINTKAKNKPIYTCLEDFRVALDIKYAISAVNVVRGNDFSMPFMKSQSRHFSTQTQNPLVHSTTEAADINGFPIPHISIEVSHKLTSSKENQNG